ncbi:MAG: twitching motility protein PilJ [Acidobacteria bacterium]|jgi:methyl-accepting chemotaxis protein|nr:twitching motility protein PilJ [Acidobacteriota bacterium]
MTRRSANSLLNSLRSKIWLATSALAFFICTFGLISYLLVSFFIADTFYVVFIPFLILSFTVMIFGWWLSNEVVSPIEKVSLLAKSLERSALVSLPKTTGSTETDELLETLHRNSQQMQTIVGLMETVAAGNIDVALTPLQNSDRLSSSFQKLLAKVSESIHAKQELEKLETAVRQISEDAVRVRKGILQGEFSRDFTQTRDISDSLKFLVRSLNDIIRQVRQDTIEAQSAAGQAAKTIRAAIQTDENVILQMDQAALALKQMPNGAEKISGELSGSVSVVNDSIEKARRGKQTAHESLNSIAVLRAQLQEALKRTGSLAEYSLEITKIAKTVEDLARRTNLIALNASIQTVENTDKNFSFSVLAEEVERLSARAGNTNNEISSLNKSIAAEIVEIENSLKATSREAANLSKFAAENGVCLSELEKDAGRFLSLQSKLVLHASEQSAENKKSLQVFLESIKMRAKAIENLKQSEASINGMNVLLENLRSSTNAFTTQSKTIESEPPRTEIVNAAQEADYTDLIVDFEEIVSV